MATSSPRLRGRTEVKSFKVEDLLEFTRDGRVRVPGFQRQPRWRSRHVIELFDSIVNGYPIGSLLFAKRAGPEEEVRLGAFRSKVPAVPDAWYVVDGQQRMSALVGAMLHPDEIPCGDIHAIWYDLERGEFFRATQSDPPETAVPLRALGRSSETLRWLRRWPLMGDREDLADRAIVLGETLREFSVSCAIVDSEDDAPLRRIFHRLNTAGAHMKESEVFAALFSHKPTSNLKAALIRLADVGFGSLTEDLFRQCMLAVEGIEPGTRSHELDADALDTMVTRTEWALRQACRFLVVDAWIPHIKLLPYSVPLRIIARFFALHPRPSQRARTLLRRWVWRGIVGGRFGSSAQGLVRRFQDMIHAEDAEGSAQALLNDLGEIVIQIDPAQEEWNPRSARCLLIALAMLQRCPRDPIDEQPLPPSDVQMLLVGAPPEQDNEETHTTEQEPESKSLSEIFLDVGGRRKASVAGRVLLRDPGALAVLADARREVLDDHLVLPEAGDVLRAVRDATEAERPALLQRFDALRAKELRSHVERFLRERCDLGASDRVSIKSLTAQVDRAFQET